MVKLVLIVALLLVSCVTPFEAAPSSEPEAAASGNGDACYLLDGPTIVPAGPCYVITADEWSTIVPCGATVPVEQTFKKWGSAQEVASFQIPGGGCFEYYMCSSSGAVEPPTVAACP